MKTEGRPTSGNYGGVSSPAHQGEPATARPQRVGSAKGPGTYFDIASTILGGDGQIEDLFLKAARDGDYSRVEQMLNQRTGDVFIDIDCKDKRTGNTALIWAAKKGNNKLIQLLMRNGADPTLRNYEAQTAVEVATGGTKTMLLDTVARATESSHRLLLQAAWQGSIEVIRRLLSSNKALDINCQNAEGLTPLMLVARDIQLFERLAVQLNKPYNPVQVALELMKNRADVHCTDNDGKSCLHYAAQSKATVAERLVETFIGGGSEPAQLDKRQYAAIHWASQVGNTNVVNALLDGGSEVNSRGFAGFTPLHISAHNDHQSTAVSLLDHGADVTLTDDRGRTPVDLAKTRKMKNTLREAWTEATQGNNQPELAPVRTLASRESGQGSRLSMRDESPGGGGRKRGGEVIFDGMTSSGAGAQRTATGSRPGAARRAPMSNAEKARRAEQQLMQEIDSGRYTPSLLHSRENTRLLGTVRTKPIPPVLPTISRGPPSPSGAECQSPDSPPPVRRNSQGEELRRSLEDGRNMLQQRAGNRRAALPSRGKLSKTTPISTNERTEHAEESHRGHKRTGSDPFSTRITDIASTLENIMGTRRGRTLSSGEANAVDSYLSSSQHISPLRAALERDSSMYVNIPTTIPEGGSPNSSTNTVSFDTETTQGARYSVLPTHVMALPPTGNRILPPTPTFLTQRSYSNLDSALGKMLRDDDSGSSKEPSPRSDDEADKFRVGLANPMELLRSRSLLKEEFVLAESRPRDPCMASSGSDPTSSSSNVSTASSSPRESGGVIGQGRSAYRRSDPTLLTVTLRDKAIRGSGFRMSDPSCIRRTELTESGDGGAEKSSAEVGGDRISNLPPNSSGNSRDDAVTIRMARSQSLRLTQRPKLNQEGGVKTTSTTPPGSASASTTQANLKRSQSIGNVPGEAARNQSSAGFSDGFQKSSSVASIRGASSTNVSGVSAATVLQQDSRVGQQQDKGMPFSGKGRMVVVRGSFSDFDNVCTVSSSNLNSDAPLPPRMSSSNAQTNKTAVSDLPENAYIKENTVLTGRSRHSSDEQSTGSRTRHNSENSRMSVSDVAISGDLDCASVKESKSTSNLAKAEAKSSTTAVAAKDSKPSSSQSQKQTGSVASVSSKPSVPNSVSQTKTTDQKSGNANSSNQRNVNSKTANISTASLSAKSSVSNSAGAAKLVVTNAAGAAKPAVTNAAGATKPAVANAAGATKPAVTNSSSATKPAVTTSAGANSANSSKSTSNSNNTQPSAKSSTSTNSAAKQTEQNVKGGPSVDKVVANSANINATKTDERGPSSNTKTGSAVQTSTAANMLSKPAPVSTTSNSGRVVSSSQSEMKTTMFVAVPPVAKGQPTQSKSSVSSIRTANNTQKSSQHSVTPIRKSASSESVSGAGAPTKPNSGEKKQTGLGPTQKSLSSSARDVTSRLSQCVTASRANSSLSQKSDGRTSANSVSGGGKSVASSAASVKSGGNANSANSVRNSTSGNSTSGNNASGNNTSGNSGSAASGKDTPRGTVPSAAKPQPMQMMGSSKPGAVSSSTSSATNKSTSSSTATSSKPSTTVTTSFVAKMMQSPTLQGAATPRSTSTKGQEQTQTSAESAKPQSNVSTKTNMPASSVKSSPAPPVSSSVHSPKAPVSSGALTSRPGQTTTSRPPMGVSRSVPASPVNCTPRPVIIMNPPSNSNIIRQDSQTDAKDVSQTSGVAKSALLKSPSDSVLDQKCESGESRNSSASGKEPLVKITFNGMRLKNQAMISKYSDPSVLHSEPVIVNPFEHLPAYQTPRDKSPCGYAGPASGAEFVVGKPDKDMTTKSNRPAAASKTRGGKVSGKKNKDGKVRPTSSTTRQHSGVKRRSKHKDKAAADGEEVAARPKSGKRVRSGRRRKKGADKLDKDADMLAQMAARGNVAFISGIGWHLAAECADMRDILPAPEMHLDSASDLEDDSDMESDAESIEDAETLMRKMEVPHGHASLTSPRFREIKTAKKEKARGVVNPIPVMTSDGFPPMNLDMTQRENSRLPLSEGFQPHREDLQLLPREFAEFSYPEGMAVDDMHKDLLARKLTPIPEMPSMTGPIGNVSEAIARFDKSLKDNQLNDMLDTPRMEVLSQAAPTTLATSTSARMDPLSIVITPDSVGALTSKETSAQESSSRTNSVRNSAKPPIGDPNMSVASASSSKHSSRSGPRRTHSLKEAGGGSGSVSVTSDKTRSKVKERKFSESKRDQQDLEDAIEEILSGTTSSMSSTLRSNTSTLKSASNTLTEGDHHLLLKLQNTKDSPFYASHRSPDDDENSSSTPIGEFSSGSERDDLTKDTNRDLLKVVHVDKYDLGAKVKAMIDAGASEEKIKAMMQADEEVQKLEARQIVKVMNSFCHMELHAGGGASHNPSHSPLVRSESHRVSKVASAMDKVPLVRPSSAGAGRTKGRFHEMKKGSAGGSSQHLDRQESKGEQPTATDPEIGLTAAVAEALAEEVARDVLGDPDASETMRSRLSRRSSQSGSACTHDSQEDETIQWKKGNVLGKGAFGTVWCGLTSEGELIAVKQIELTTTDRRKAEREYEKVQEEVELLKTLNHINIVGYLGTSFEDSTVSIFMQFVPGGSIASILARFGALDEAVFRRYTRQILQGVEYLHDNDVIHRDIKGGNVMLMPNGIIKLIDFGCAKRLCINLSLSQSQILRSMKGTPYWMAPEVVNESGHGKKSDIWSIGCTVFEMATMKPPWAEMNPMAAIFAIGSDRTVPKLPTDRFSPEAIHFVDRCLTRDQHKRASATELLQDTFMMERPSKK